MNPITQADVGSSLATIYDTVGQQSGGPQAQLETDRILLVHEMGHVIASELFALEVRRLTVTTQQSLSFNAVIDDLPNGPFRILGFRTWVDAGVAADLNAVAVLQRNPDSGREVPLWVWNGGTYINVRADTGVGVGTVAYLCPTAADSRLNDSWLQSMGSSAPRGRVSALALRGTTAAYGAGDRTFTTDVLIAFMLPQVGTVQYGLPIPSW